MTDIQGFEVQASPEIVQHWGWLLTAGDLTGLREDYDRRRVP